MEDKKTFITEVTELPEHSELATLLGQLDVYDEEQAKRRKELASYMEDLKEKIDDQGQPLVDFPEKYDEVVQTMASGEKDFWESFAVSDVSVVPKSPAVKDVHDKFTKGMEEIKRLDKLLAAKTKEARAIAGIVVKKPAKAKRISTPPKDRPTTPSKKVQNISEEEEARLKGLLEAENSVDDDGGYAAVGENAERLKCIEEGLEKLTDDPNQWEMKTEGTWRPDTALSASPPDTARTFMSRASMRTATSKPYEPGDEYLDQMKEERYMRERIREINKHLRNLHTERDVSQDEIRQVLNALISSQSDNL